LKVRLIEYRQDQRVLTRKGRVAVIKNPKEEVGTEVKEEAWHKSEL
jgi:hypothetical protein